MWRVQATVVRQKEKEGGVMYVLLSKSQREIPTKRGIHCQSAQEAQGDYAG
jgi:hypothetical protein